MPEAVPAEGCYMSVDSVIVVEFIAVYADLNHGPVRLHMPYRSGNGRRGARMEKREQGCKDYEGSAQHQYLTM